MKLGDSGQIKQERLPEGLRRFFWDVDFDELTMEKYPVFITERILNYGDPDSVKWLSSRISTEFIKNLIQNSRNLNPKTKNYWKLILL